MNCKRSSLCLKSASLSSLVYFFPYVASSLKYLLVSNFVPKSSLLVGTFFHTLRGDTESNLEQRRYINMFCEGTQEKSQCFCVSLAPLHLKSYFF